MVHGQLPVMVFRNCCSHGNLEIDADIIRPSEYEDYEADPIIMYRTKSWGSSGITDLWFAHFTDATIDQQSGVLYKSSNKRIVVPQAALPGLISTSKLLSIQGTTVNNGYPVLTFINQWDIEMIDNNVVFWFDYCLASSNYRDPKRFGTYFHIQIYDSEF